MKSEDLKIEMIAEKATLTARARTWSGWGVSTERFAADADGTVSVWDPIAGHYTTCHALSDSAERRIRKIAASM